MNALPLFCIIKLAQVWELSDKGFQELSSFEKGGSSWQTLAVLRKCRWNECHAHLSRIEALGTWLKWGKKPLAKCKRRGPRMCSRGRLRLSFLCWSTWNELLMQLQSKQKLCPKFPPTGAHWKNKEAAFLSRNSRLLRQQPSNTKPFASLPQIWGRAWQKALCKPELQILESVQKIIFVGALVQKIATAERVQKIGPNGLAISVKGREGSDHGEGRGLNSWDLLCRALSSGKLTFWSCLGRTLGSKGRIEANELPWIVYEAVNVFCRIRSF